MCVMDTHMDIMQVKVTGHKEQSHILKTGYPAECELASPV